MVASILAAKYQVVIDEKMMIRAIKTEQFDFLYFVYAYNKNFEKLAEQDDEEEDPDQGDMARCKIFTYDWLIKKIILYKEKKCDELLEEVMKWELKSNENILKSLLINCKDMIAADFGHT